MALDREALRKPVREAREALTADLVDVLEGTYGIHRTGVFEDPSRLPALAVARARETRELLELVLPPRPAGKAERECFEEAFEAAVRSLAFTHLNRLVAFKMMEHPTRKILRREAVGKGLKSPGLMFYLADHPEDEDLYRGAQQDLAYQHYLLWLAGEYHREIGVLFDPDDLASRVFPQPKALAQVLAILNDEALAGAWEHEEALGWVYQFYTPKELREKARKQSQAPRNAYELAFRNQFYTPDYVVRFLTDNTLGRLWLEMKPDTALRERCAYLVVRPDEVIAARTKKDPREIRVLDPACGSGHFLLYAFELFEVIYREAYGDPELGPALALIDPDRAGFEQRIPALIVEHNLHGIDIDKRATQIASLVLFLKAKTRNKAARIERGNIVCAEPMPGDRALFEDFKRRKLGNAAGVRARILDGLWRHLELAGEAGSLLKAEGEVERLVAEEHEKWREYQRKRRGQQVFAEMRAPEQQEIDFQDVTDAQFWSTTEGEIETLLGEYAGDAAGAQAAHRKMFAKDGIEGLRFIDAVRRPYDVVLMNPPFGEPSTGSDAYVNDTYPEAQNDIYAAMIVRGASMVAHSRGLVGAITSRAFVVGRDMRRYRSWLLRSPEQKLNILFDLGASILDTALVETCAYTIGHNVTDSALFADARAIDRVQLPRIELFRALAFKRMQLATFRALHGDEIVYTLGDVPQANIERVLTTPCGTFEPDIGRVTYGLTTASDPRFIRLRWEVSSEKRGTTATWHLILKGGEYQWFSGDVHLVINRAHDGLELAALASQGDGNVARTRRSSHYYDKAAAVCSRRSQKGFSARRLRKGCVFSDKSVVIVPSEQSFESVAWIAPALATEGYLRTIKAHSKFGSYEVGAVKRLPVPSNCLREQAQTWRAAYDLVDQVEQRDETCALFVGPPDPSWSVVEVVRSALDTIEKGLAACQLEFHPEVVPLQLKVAAKRAVELRPERSRLSYALGAALGRFDVRVATGERSAPELPDPFAALPVYSPGMLPGGKIPDGYPLVIDDDGILVDDEGHEDDIVARIRDVLRLIWKDNAEAIEREACNILKVKSLRDYFRKPGNGGFWTDHVKRYSKSRRKAPIYWLLQSDKGSYGVWLYLHKLDKDTLHKVLGPRYLDGKIRRVRAEVSKLRIGGKLKPGITRKEEKQLEDLDAVEAELTTFETRIRTVVERTNERGEIVGYAPDLDDGVVLNAAPLHALIPWPAKKKYQGRAMSKLEVYWHELEEGEYDWAHLAMRHWPDRVTAKCRTDKSLAIAHGLDEALFPGLRDELRRRAEEAGAEGEAKAGEDDGEGDESEDDDGDEEA